MVGGFYYTIEILKSDCYTVNLKRECLGRQALRALSTLKLTFSLNKQQSNQACWVFYPKAFTLLKRQMSELVWLPPRQKGGIYAEAVSKDATGCSSMQRYPDWLLIWSRITRILWPLNFCLPKILPYGRLLKWWAWTQILTMSKYFLGFSQSDSFSLQTGFRLQTQVHGTSYLREIRVSPGCEEKMTMNPKLPMKRVTPVI